MHLRPRVNTLCTTMKPALPLILALLLCPSCSGSFEGIRLRARAPAIDDAFRRISIAVGLDGYEIALSDAGSRRLETTWREMKKEEWAAGERDVDGMVMRSRLTLSLLPRGIMYDVLLGVYVRYVRQNGEVEDRAVPADHPLATKWYRTLNALVDRESREED